MKVRVTGYRERKKGRGNGKGEVLSNGNDKIL